MKFLNLSRQDIFVIKQLAHKDKSRENASSFLGQIWQILNPFISTVVLMAVFSTMFANKKFVNFPMFIATGTIFYELFGSGTKNCLNALVSNKNFLIKTQIEKRIYVMERIYVALINFGYSMFIYVCLMLYFRIPFRWTMFLLVPDTILLLMVIYGIGKILAIINVLFADITYFYQIFTLFVFYGSDIFYDPGRVTGIAQMFLSVNPVYISIAIARITILDGIIPSIGLWLKLLLYAIFLVLVGDAIWKKGIRNIVSKI